MLVYYFDSSTILFYLDSFSRCNVALPIAACDSLFNDLSPVIIILFSIYFLKDQKPLSKLISTTNNQIENTPTSLKALASKAITTSNSVNDNSVQSQQAQSNRVEMMQTIFSYKAVHADELTFEEGAIITVLGRDEPEWWRGRLQNSGAEGLFPVNYVRPYNPPSQTEKSSNSVNQRPVVPAQSKLIFFMKCVSDGYFSQYNCFTFSLFFFSWSC